MSEYKRITEKDSYGYWCIRNERKELISAPNREIQKVFDYLAELEDEIESGDILILPCKVGDTIYYIEYFCRYKGCSADTQQWCCGCQEMLERERKNEKYLIVEKKFRLTDLSSIGKKYFIDKAEAKARLKELKGEGV